ncbi:hypothetical protein HPO96_00305 [Kribbella sandramycini]|uniref:Uncharacterized protein n=1 Tax=Kribbella sandramycini TaxID=60450 RepID=A0A7Y4KU34_9ACTN|nr:hypothetical protein [Kribbella sandramycini]MBB6568740.1 hypothetical protein [Kribbella sandramycini]NOL38677.1 hypothetical protein [Kribbella sandramycini]
MREQLTEYVDEQTPAEAPPFEYVERAARGRRTRNRLTAAVVAAVVMAAVATFAVVDRPRADQQPVAPPTEQVKQDFSDGPPPENFRYNSTLMVLLGEVRITSITALPDQPMSLQVTVPPGKSRCVPDTVVQILHEDAKSVRIAAYRYQLAPDQVEDVKCDLLAAPRPVQLELQRPLTNRTVYAGAAGSRALPY